MSRPKRWRRALLVVLPLGALALRSLVVEGTGAGARHEGVTPGRLSLAPRSRGWTTSAAPLPARGYDGREVAARERRENRALPPVEVAERAPIDDDPGDATVERVEVVYLPRARLLDLVTTGLSDPDAPSRMDALRLVEANALPEVAWQVERLALGDPDETVRRIATRTLALDGGLGLLRRLARDADVGVRAFAFWGLSRRGERGAEELLALCLASARQEAPALVPAIERLLASARDE
ncbi:MAG TPA: hypothetical protein VFF73_06765 [Planctomycetota bacterium]|nr:hypothetical protein [Planctomycetota bacterium]